LIKDALVEEKTKGFMHVDGKKKIIGPAEKEIRGPREQTRIQNSLTKITITSRSTAAKGKSRCMEFLAVDDTVADW